MGNSREMMKSTLVALVLVAMVQSVSAAEKLASCCKTVTNQELTEPITGYMVQRPNPPCVLAVIFQTETGLYCSQLTAPWVRRKIIAFERSKAEATSSSAVPSSSASLLSIITSTASLSTSSTPFSSSSLSSSPSSPLSSSSPSSFSTPLSSSSSSSSPLPTSSAPSSSSPASVAPTSEMPDGETFSEDMDEYV